MTLPSGFKEQLSFLNSVEFDELNAALNSPANASLRINLFKWHQPVQLEKVQWADHGHYLSERPNFTCDPLLHAGTYYVQEASSMVIGFIVERLLSDLPERAVVLDLCAAPGGKSTDLAARLRPGDLLLSNEVIRSRARVLKENVIKWGAPSHWVSSNDPEDFKQLPGLFDLILIDAPCSGEGLFRKDPNAKYEWSPEAVTHCQKRQQRILADAWECLAEDGFLIYATCTYNQSENEAVLQWLTTNHEATPISMDVEVYGFRAFEQNGFPLYKAFHHLVKGEGFSFFVIQKKESVRCVISKGKRKKDHRKKRSVETYIQNPEGEGLVMDEVLYYIEDLSLRDLLAERLHLIRSGMRIGEYKKHKLVPDHELAMSWQCGNTYPIIDLDYEQAIKYLKKEPFDLPVDEKGLNLLRYRQVNLGFVNHLGNRFNSLLPAGYRIHSQPCNAGDPKII